MLSEIQHENQLLTAENNRLENERETMILRLEDTQAELLRLRNAARGYLDVSELKLTGEYMTCPSCKRLSSHGKHFPNCLAVACKHELETLLTK